MTPYRPELEATRRPTDEELDELVIDEEGLPNSHLEFGRAIEYPVSREETLL